MKIKKQSGLKRLLNVSISLFSFLSNVAGVTSPVGHGDQTVVSADFLVRGTIEKLGLDEHILQDSCSPKAPNKRSIEMMFRVNF